MEQLVMSSGPHIHSGASDRRIMLDVILALLPATVAGVILFGVPALWVILTCVLSAVISEFLFNLIARKKQSVGDLSAVVTGLLLALNLSVNVPLWQAALGTVFAIVLVKCVFGGIGRNFANPAITGRVFLLVAFPSTVAGGALPRGIDAASSATPLDLIGVEGAELPSLLQMFLGQRGGAIGETCILALLIGFAYLLLRKVIRWEIPVLSLASAALLGWILGTDPLTTVMTGGLLFGAVFMATDYVTTPMNWEARAMYAVGIGVIVVLIRKYGSYPEGVTYAILLMNIAAPLFDRIPVHRVYGHAKAKKEGK